MNLIKFTNIVFQYSHDESFKFTLNNLEIKQGDQLFINGPSGCGKTTFLNLLTGLSKPQEGHIDVFGTPISTLSPSQSDQFRANHMGIIFQQFNLIPYLSILENITLPCRFSKTRKTNALQHASTLTNAAIHLCESLDLNLEHRSKPVHQLSVGQQQRVAIARALIGNPSILIADEPTSALDTERKDEFMKTLLTQCKTCNTTLIFVSHDNQLSRYFNQLLPLKKPTS